MTRFDREREEIRAPIWLGYVVNDGGEGSKHLYLRIYRGMLLWGLLENATRFATRDDAEAASFLRLGGIESVEIEGMDR